MKGFRLTISNMPEKHLYENKYNHQMYAILKLGFSSNYDGFEVDFTKVVNKNADETHLVLYGLGHKIFGELPHKLQGLPERKMDEFIANEKYSHQNTL